MFLASKPITESIERFLAECVVAEPFSYDAVGLSRTGSPAGYNVDNNRIRVGLGEADFEKAKEAIKAWKMFDMPWVELCWPTTSIEEDRTVAILIRHFGFYSLNAARIVYVIDEPVRFGFAYGTLAEHGESGEERFMVEMDADSGEVWYDLFAFSKPNHFLAMLGYPFARHLQKQFANDSKAAMLCAVNRKSEPSA